MMMKSDSLSGKHKYKKLEKPSLHALVFAAKLTGVSVKLPPTDAGAANGNVSHTPVQDLWERSFKEIGEENPEQNVTGMLLFYPYQLTGYLESNEEGIRKCLQVLASLSTKDSSKLNDYKIANIQHNIQNRLFPSNIFVRSMEPPSERDNKGHNRSSIIMSSMMTSNSDANTTGGKSEKNQTFQHRLKLTNTCFQLIGYFRKQTTLSVKKAMDLVCEKMTSLLPEPSNIEAVALDKSIPNPLPNMTKYAFYTVTLGEDEVWPMPKESFQLNVIL